MNKNIMNGTIIKLDEDENKEFVVIDSIVKNDKQYILLHPFELKDDDIVELDYQKMTLIELVGEDDFEYVKDENLVKELIEELLKK